MKAPLPPNEAQRLATLREYGILDSPPESAFDDLTQLASHICETPIALLTLVDGQRQWFKSRVGIDIPETHRDISFCAHAILESDVFVIQDAMRDMRFADNPVVTGEMQIRFYAGAQLVTQSGAALGTLCVADRVPRQLTSVQIDSLRALARQAMAQLELRRHVRGLEVLLGERREVEAALERRAALALEQQAVLVELARLEKSDLCSALQEITRVDAETLGVERVSIWFFDRARSEIVCEDMFERSAGRHSMGARIQSSGAPRYFDALRQQRVIAATDARTDPRTSEFAEEYLVPNGITSMLDVPVWRDGDVVGIVCHEHTGTPREWQPSEQDFAASIADMVSISLESHRRRRMESELRAREQQLVTTQRLAGLGSWRWDVASNRVTWSDELYRIYGLEPGDFAATFEAYMERVHPEDRVLAAQAIEKAVQNCEPFEFEERIIRPDGSVRMLHSIGEPAVDGRGRVVRLVGACHDITEQKQTEEALRRAHDELERRVEERTAELALANAALQAEIVERTRAENELRRRTCEMEAIFQAFPDLYFRLDPQGAIVDYHAGTNDLYVQPEEFLGRAMQDVLPDAVGKQFASAVSRVIASRQPTAFEYALPVSGEKRAFEARVLPLPDEHLMTIVRDITQRKQAEEALKRSEEHFRLLIENSSDMATVIDSTGTALYASPSVERVLGYRQQDVLGVNALAIVHPDDQSRMRTALDFLLAHPGEELSVEYRVRAGSDAWRTIEGIARTLLTDSPAAGVVINSRDITERKHAEEELRLQKTLLEAQGEASVDGILVISESGSMLSYNRRFVEMWGLPDEVLKTRSDDAAVKFVLDQLVDPDTFTKRVAALYAAPHERSQDEIELKDGRVFDRRSGPVTSADGRYYGRIWFFRDITERKESERRLRQSEEYFRSLIENGGDIIGIIDAEGVIRYDSPSVERVLGYAPAELTGRSVFDYLAEDDVARTREMLAGVIASPGVGVPVEFHFRHADGSYRLLEAVGKRLVLEGRLEGVVVNARDVTQRKRQEEAVQQAMHQAQEARELADRANRAKSEFLSRMSHELRTPMNSILGFAQLMTKRELPPDQRKALDHILRAGRHLLNLINEVLDIARIESNRQQFSIEPVRVSAVLGETLSLIRPLATQHAVRVESHIAMEGDPYVSADRQRFIQVLLNLLSNAAKYNRPGGTVRVSCARHEPEDGRRPRLRIKVHDTGYGIPPEKLDRLFTPFERLGAEQSEVEGTGLGLALSKRLVEAMGGALDVETRAGEGSTFTVELPLIESPVERLAQNGGLTTGRAMNGSDRTATVLYIEDNLANLSLIETILAGRPEITLMSALQGQLGIELAWQHRPDLILLDLHLPDMSGDEVLRRLRADARTRGTPVLVISADATTGRTQRLLDAGANAYMTKPLDVEDFLQTIDRLLIQSNSGTPG